jgi:hypothetical protein
LAHRFHAILCAALLIAALVVPVPPGTPGSHQTCHHRRHNVGHRNPDRLVQPAHQGYCMLRFTTLVPVLIAFFALAARNRSDG